MFDWDPRKADANAAKHGVTFEAAMTSFWIPSRWMALTSHTPGSKPAVFGWVEQRTVEC